MKMKKILSLILALILCAFALVSCAGDKNKGEESSSTVAEAPLTDELKNYTIIRSGEQDDTATMGMKIAAAIESLVGAKPNVRIDENTPADDNSFEILIGDTNRAQSAEAKAALSGLEFSVTKNGNKIVIAATHAVLCTPVNALTVAGHKS